MFTSLVMAGCSTATNDLVKLNTTAEIEKKVVLSKGFDPDIPADKYAQLCDTLLANASSQFQSLENDTSSATLESVFGRFDALVTGTQGVRQSWYLKAVHPDEKIRKAATDCTVKYSDLYSGFSMSNKYYQRVAAIDTSHLNTIEKNMVKNALEDFRLAGVDKDEATRN